MRVTRTFGSSRGVDATHSSHRRTREADHGGGPRCRTRSERGSSLILALVYIISISLIVGALADWAMNDLSNTTHFQNASSSNNAISGATEVAIQSVRYQPYLFSSGPNANMSPNYGNCWNPTSTAASDVTINNSLVAVWCSTLENLKSPNTRIVTFAACVETANAVTSANETNTMGLCTAAPTLKAVVTIDDYPSGGGGLLTQTCLGGQGICGFAATTNQWTWA
jgi:hypothetical protein